MYNLPLLLVLLLTFLFTKSICNEYCNLHYNHLLCVLPPISNNCYQFKEVIPDERERWQIVDWHNRMRQRVAQGLESRGSGGPQPSASNMMRMEWDPELARMAQRLVNQCRFEHSCKKCRRIIGGRFSVGENVAVLRYYNQEPKSFDFVFMMKRWYEKVSRMRPSIVDKYFHSVNWGHYTQLVWWNTRSVGCGGSSYTRSGVIHQLVACQYGASANLEFAKVYERGPLCSNCPLDTGCDPYYHGLCSITRHPFNVEDAFTHTDQEYLGLPPGSYIKLK